MNQSFASLTVALVATATLASAGAASAQSFAAADLAAFGPGYSASDAPLGAPTELRIDLRGRIEARCELVTPPAAMTQLHLTDPGQAQASFALDCNTPFVLRVRSNHGGFTNEEASVGVEPVLPYEVAVEVETDMGRQDLGWCEAAALTDTPDSACIYAPTAAERGWSSGEATAIGQRGSLRLRWTENQSERPLLGAYQDTVVIELEVRS
ncbi:hypothetical protein [Brevundimonas lenta]|uniref:Spore coat protein U domain-containing protein n=1 Tax=Brevundimonas lenta TaxID=424796 RepID=A0A7W6NPM8_9CAUL|nr:hypothetical protein [Brevundimonas lenta]MBB4082322.1 hypothetical protein [Brevundimonas lenta]